MRVWFMRHGETQANKNGTWQGQTDVPLSQRGIAQAVKLRDSLARVKFDKVYSSDLSRAKNTAELSIPGAEIEALRELREVDVGSLAGTSFLNMSETLLSSIKDGFALYGGEAYSDLKNRAASFLNKLEKENAENAAVFTHGGVIRILFSIITGIPFPSGSMISDNCMIAIVEYAGGKWRLHSWINQLEDSSESDAKKPPRDDTGKGV